MPPLPFGKKLDIALIKMVRQHPHLYDTNQTRYTDAESREETWAKIGAELKRSGADCKTRWVNIRDQLRRKYRERMNGKRGSQVKYKYEDQLDFIVHPAFPGTGQSEMPEPEDSVYFSGGEDAAQAFLDVDVEQEQDSDDDPMDSKNAIRKSIIRMETASTSSNAEPPPAPNLLNVSDPIDVFLLSVGSTLRKFSPYYLNQAKSKIFQTISEYELEQIMDQRNNPLV